MSSGYANDLRSDTSFIIVPILTVVAIAVSVFQIAFRMSLAANWSYAVMLLGALLVGNRTWRLLRAGRNLLAAQLFLSSHVVMLALVHFQDWMPGSFMPYLYGILIVVGSMMVRPTTGFWVWGWGMVLTGTAVFLGNDLLFMEVLQAMLPPTLVNLLLATATFLSAMEWQFAVESVSELHRNVQRRRDELFSVQEELQDANVRLQNSNVALEEARLAAVNERDLRTRFMNHVSHELRTPLNAIVNFAHILNRGVRGPINDGQSDYLTRIRQSGFHLLNVLNDLLDMAQIEAGEFRLRLEPVALQPICEEGMTNVRGLLLEKQVLLVRDYPDDWPLVMADKIRLTQALINLLGNAAKYTEEGYIALRVRHNGRIVTIVVEDSGIGIPPEQHEAIFQEFRQVDESAARRRVGTGLGLPITRHLIERHGGTVRVESDPGSGSRFIITLPVAQADVETVPLVANGYTTTEAAAKPEDIGSA